MSRRALAMALLVSAPLLGCGPYFRPNHPLRASSGSTTVDVRQINFRTSDLEVALSDSRPGATIDGAWITATQAPDGVPCGRKAAAKAVHVNGSSASGVTYAARFDRAKLGTFGAIDPGDSRLADLLQNPSTLEVRVVGDGEPARCLSLPISGDAPEVGWTLVPWGKNPLFAGQALKSWFPVGTSRSATFATDWIPLRLGRWWGPVRIGAGVGLGFAWGSSPNPNGAIVIPGAISAETFPLVGRRFALGLVAAYDLRPTFFRTTGFELIHGPSAGLELAFLPVALPGFLKGPQAGTIGLAATIGRWLPDGGATVIGVGLTMN
jgi:hypothetical protein